MSRIAPPPLADWALIHLVPGELNDALAGDLHEEFRAGRSAAWYWRQVISAIAVRSTGELRMRRGALFFAALWSMLAPAWMLAIAGLERHARLSECLARMTWPWSIGCDLGLTLAASLLFLWTGVLLYLFPDLWLTGELRFRSLARGIVASVPAVIVFWLTLIVFPRHFVAMHAGPQMAVLRAPTPLEAYRFGQHGFGAARSSDEGMQPPATENGPLPEASPRGALTDTRTPANLVRLPFFLVVLCTLWPSVARAKRYAG